MHASSLKCHVCEQSEQTICNAQQRQRHCGCVRAHARHKLHDKFTAVCTICIHAIALH